MGLSACGFTPIYSGESVFRQNTAFVSDDTVAGFRLREQLEERLGRTDTPKYLVSTQISLNQRSAAITSDGDTSRFNVIGTATWTLRDAATNARIETGTVETFTSYSATSSTIATQATQDDAVERLSIILADMIVSRLLALTPEHST